MIQAELLNSSHFEALSGILSRQKTYFGLDISKFPGELTTKKALYNYLNNYLRSENPYFRCFGCFDEKRRLLGTISADFMQNQPTWILRRIVVDEDLKGATTSNEIIHSLMTAVLNAAEDAKYYQHIYLIPAKYERAHGRIWAQNDVRKGRYTAVQLEHVKANSTSRFRDHWELLYGRLTFPIDTVVRMSYLNAEFRSQA